MLVWAFSRIFVVQVRQLVNIDELLKKRQPELLT